MMDEIFDRRSIRLHRERAVQIGDRGAAFLLNRVAEEVADRLAMVQRQFKSAVMTSGNSELIDTSTLSGLPLNVGVTHGATWSKIDEEKPFEGEAGHDLALSLLTLHETNDTPGALIQIRKHLRPDGLFMGVMPGAGTLQELRESWLVAETELKGGVGPRILPFADVRTAGSLLQRAGFALPVVDEEKVTVRYADMFALMRDLRNMGAMSSLAARRKAFTSRAVMVRAAEVYGDRFGETDGRIPATFNFIFMSGWAPDQSQQKPLRRGSATVSLAEALTNAGKANE
jgi:SAM-dependent methyltransferase